MKAQGSSFIELLISLALVTTVSLALTQQQLQLNILVQRVFQRAWGATWLENQSERLLANQPIGHLKKPYRFVKTNLSPGLRLTLLWGIKDSHCCQIKREGVAGI